MSSEGTYAAEVAIDAPQIGKVIFHILRCANSQIQQFGTVLSLRNGPHATALSTLFPAGFVSFIRIGLACFELDEAAISGLDGQRVGNVEWLRRFDRQRPFYLKIYQR